MSDVTLDKLILTKAARGNSQAPRAAAPASILSITIKSAMNMPPPFSKAQQKTHPKLPLTQIYNVLDKLHAGETVESKDREVYDAGLIGILRDIHDKGRFLI